MKKVGIVLSVFLCLWAEAVKSQYIVLHNFNHTDGAGPTGDVTLVGGSLYGMTDSGGTYNKGCVFSMDTNGSNYKVLFNFDSINGAWPSGSLVHHAGLLYGMASLGGAYKNGCVFSIDTNGNRYREMLDFNGTNGSQPFGSLIYFSGKLYGMTYFGGRDNQGCVFSMDTNGSEYADILDFNGINGAWPMGSLIISGKVLYGMTGETGMYGNIFSVDTDGNAYKDLYDFPNASNKSGNDFPYGSLTLSGNKLYGMTSKGDNFPYVGNIFSIDTNGNDYKDMFDFDLDDGASPYGSLSLSGNTLYGMTFAEGLNSQGNIFSIDTNGSGFRDLFDFSHSTGGDPWGDVALSGNMLYGMTSSGGTDNAGVIFKFNYVTAGVNNITAKKGKISVYPNPNNGNVTVQVNIGQPENVEFTLYNLLGEPVYSDMENEPTGTINKHISLSSLPNGEYILQVIADGNVYHTKITKLQ